MGPHGVLRTAGRPLQNPLRLAPSSGKTEVQVVWRLQTTLCRSHNITFFVCFFRTAWHGLFWFPSAITLDINSVCVSYIHCDVTKKQHPWSFFLTLSGKFITDNQSVFYNPFIKCTNLQVICRDPCQWKHSVVDSVMRKEWQKANSYFPGWPDTYWLGSLCLFDLIQLFIFTCVHVARGSMLEQEVHKPAVIYLCLYGAAQWTGCTLLLFSLIYIYIRLPLPPILYLWKWWLYGRMQRKMCRYCLRTGLESNTKDGNIDKEKCTFGLSQPRVRKVWLCKLWERTHTHVHGYQATSALSVLQWSTIMPQTPEPSMCVQDSGTLSNW